MGVTEKITENHICPFFSSSWPLAKCRWTFCPTYARCRSPRWLLLSPHTHGTCRALFCACTQTDKTSTGTRNSQEVEASVANLKPRGHLFLWCDYFPRTNRELSCSGASHPTDLHDSQASHFREHLSHRPRSEEMRKKMR